MAFLLKFVPDINPEELHAMFPDEILKDFIDEATYASLSAEDKISYIKAMYADMDRACEIEYAENKGEEKGRADEKQEIAKKMMKSRCYNRSRSRKALFVAILKVQELSF